MKRYFDIPTERLTLQISVNEIGMRYTVDQIEKSLKITGLKEIGFKEYKQLNKEYENPISNSNCDTQLSFS